jgi:hypothetical protein
MEGVIMAKWLYAFKDPLGSGDVKIGITGNPKSRLGTYQCAYSAKKHVSCFDIVWEGPDEPIQRLEQALKTTYNWNIESDKLGESEWVADIGFDKIVEEVETTIVGHRFKISRLPIEFPMTQDDCAWGGIGKEHWRKENDR